MKLTTALLDDVNRANSRMFRPADQDRLSILQSVIAESETRAIGQSLTDQLTFPQNAKRRYPARKGTRTVDQGERFLACQDRMPIAQSETGQSLPPPRDAVSAQQRGTPTQAAPVGTGGGR